jgi:ABC-type transporter Mla MlaB component
MAVEPTESKTISLTGPITIYYVSAVRETLRSALSEGKQLWIDLGESGEWDLAGMQLLISCAKTALKQDQVVRLMNIPKGCADVAERSGLSDWLRGFGD